MCINWFWTKQHLMKVWDEKLIKYKKLSKVSSKVNQHQNDNRW